MILTYALLLLVSLALLVALWMIGSLRRELATRSERRTDRTIERELLIDSLRDEVKILRARLMVQEVFGGRHDV